MPFTVDLIAACVCVLFALIEPKPRWRLFWIACGLGFLALTLAHWRVWL